MELKVYDSLEKIAAADWQNVTSDDFPFSKHAFLLALEKTNCLGGRTGWQPFYLTCWQSTDLVGAMLLYAKSNSYGEYIFDFAWADAYARLGLKYYPKFVSAIPFTSATGPKIMLAKNLTNEECHEITSKLLTLTKELAQANRVSSTHALFITENEISKFESNDFVVRHSFQYHWLNENFASFDNFLAKFRAKRRKETLRERAQAESSGLKIQRLTGALLESKHAEAMFRFYESTVDEKGGFSYLTQDFFREIFNTMKDDILFVLAEKPNGEPIAGALYFIGRETLYGRNWGALEHHKALHFEICYYQGIEFAIEKRLKLFEAGAQGEHKFQRGFLPRLTYSAHQIYDSRLKPAIAQFIDEEKSQLKQVFAMYDQHNPFAKNNGS